MSRFNWWLVAGPFLVAAFAWLHWPIPMMAGLALWVWLGWPDPPAEEFEYEPDEE